MMCSSCGRKSENEICEECLSSLKRIEEENFLLLLAD